MDGRSCEDYRSVEVETDVVSNTSGSARVKLVSAVATFMPRGVGKPWGDHTKARAGSFPTQGIPLDNRNRALRAVCPEAGEVRVCPT